MEHTMDDEKNLNTDLRAQDNESRLFIKGVIPKQNGNTRLAKQIIGTSSLQMFFLLPDDTDHLVEVECSDSLGVFDVRQTYEVSQFKYLIYPEGSDPTVTIRITVDGLFAYGKRVTVPKFLRKRSNDERASETLESKEIEQNTSSIETEKSADLATETLETSKADRPTEGADIVQQSCVDLDSEFDVYDLSNVAMKMLKERGNV